MNPCRENTWHTAGWRCGQSVNPLLWSVSVVSQRQWRGLWERRQLSPGLLAAISTATHQNTEAPVIILLNQLPKCQSPVCLMSAAKQERLACLHLQLAMTCTTLVCSTTVNKSTSIFLFCHLKCHSISESADSLKYLINYWFNCREFASFLCFI